MKCQSSITKQSFIFHHLLLFFPPHVVYSYQFFYVYGLSDIETSFIFTHMKFIIRFYGCGLLALFESCTHLSADVGCGLPASSIAFTHRSTDTWHGLDASPMSYTLCLVDIGHDYPYHLWLAFVRRATSQAMTLIEV